MALTKELPRFIQPMLATPGTIFDADDYLFEIKWDGTRTLAFIDKDGYRLVNRRRIDMTDRYPEFDFLARLEPGTVLDGEMVMLKDGKAHFELLLSREQARSPLKIRTLSRALPATYIVFDQLYESYRSLMSHPLEARRQELERLVRECRQPRLLLSQGVIGTGTAFFHEACRRSLEGVVAKRLLSRYLPGKRTEAWIKIKKGKTILCGIIGFLPSGRNDFRSLILAADVDGRLRYVGKVGTGFDNALRARLNALLWSRLQARPLIRCKVRGNWIEPGLYCKVSYLETTGSGELRSPVFEELLEK